MREFLFLKDGSGNYYICKYYLTSTYSKLIKIIFDSTGPAPVLNLIPDSIFLFFFRYFFFNQFLENQCRKNQFLANNLEWYCANINQWIKYTYWLFFRRAEENLVINHKFMTIIQHLIWFFSFIFNLLLLICIFLLISFFIKRIEL